MRVFKGHTQQLSCLDVASKGGIEGHLYTASWDKCVRRFDPLTGEMLLVFRGHTQPIYCVQVTEDTLFTGSRDGTARVWDIENGDILHTFRGHERGSTRGGGAIYCLQLIPNFTNDDGDVLLTAAADGTVRMWDPVTGTPRNAIEVCPGSWVFRIHVVDSIIYCACFDKIVRSFELHSGELLQVFKGHSKPIWCMQVDEPYLYTGSEDSSVRVWDTNTGEQIQLLQGHEAYTSIMCLHYYHGVLYSGCTDCSARHWLLSS